MKLVHRQVILAKVETTYNTDAAPTAASDAVLVSKLSYKPAGLKMAKREAIKATLGTLQQVYAGMLIEATIDVEMRGSGTAGTAPEIDALLQCCGLASTVVAATSVTYAPASSNQASSTIYIYEDGSLFKITGARGTFKLAAKVGELPMLTFTVTGHLTAPTDVALPTASYETTVPPAFVDAPFSVGAYGALIETFDMDMGNQVEMPPEVSAADGYGEVIIGLRDVKGTMDPNATLVATNDFWGQFQAGTTMALDTGVVGTSAGNQWELKMPALYYEEAAQAERNQIITYHMSYAAAEVSGDDEFSLAFT